MDERLIDFLKDNLDNSDMLEILDLALDQITTLLDEIFVANCEENNPVKDSYYLLTRKILKILKNHYFGL